MENQKKLDELIRNAAEITIRLGILLLLLAWCFNILAPFAGVLLWSIILAMAISPVYVSLNKRLGGRSKLTATILVLIGLTIALFPGWLFLDSVITGAKELSMRLDSGTLTIPPPTKNVAEWPIIGDNIYGLWNEASTNLEMALNKYDDQLSGIARHILNGLLGVGGAIVQFVLATIIAGVLLATKGTGKLAHNLFTKLAGNRGDEFVNIASKTVGNVTKGVLGVAIIQAILLGIGFLLAGIPYAGIWTIIVMVLAILQLPATLVVIPIIIYLFSTTGTLPATLWSIYLLLAAVSDNILKPILLGKGAEVPMVVIFLGVVGGFIFSGFIGLFTGAIVLSLGYKLFVSWIEDTSENDTSISS